MTITTASLTGGGIQEAGLFDELMRSIKSQLESEYEKGRIKGSDYANVYLGAMTSAMQTSASFVLSAERVNQEILLLIEQIRRAEQEVVMTQAQVDKLVADTAISVKQLDVLETNINQSEASIILTGKQSAKVDSEIQVTNKQVDVMAAQILKTSADTQLVDQTKANTLNQNTSITKQQLKLDAEVSVLQQKRRTEEAQILDVVNGNGVAGIIGKQAHLYSRQADGYLRDAEQKASKIMADFWVVQRTTDETLPPSSGMGNSNIDAVLARLRQGVGV